MLNASDIATLREAAPCRSTRLFSEFLPRGYKMTTLDTVEKKDEVICLKVILGTLITIYDDFADMPERFNPGLLKHLYEIPFNSVKVHKAFLTDEEHLTLKLCESLFKKLINGMKKFPHYQDFAKIFEFDLKQFFLANQYSELVTGCPRISNTAENRLYLHHNMGIVMAGVIDLMSLPEVRPAELGPARAVFLCGQRAGRISNVLTTFERELREGDFTNELLAEGVPGNPRHESARLEKELSQMYHDIGKKSGDIRGFSVHKYRDGIENLHHLHVQLKGVI